MVCTYTGVGFVGIGIFYQQNRGPWQKSLTKLKNENYTPGYTFVETKI